MTRRIINGIAAAALVGMLLGCTEAPQTYTPGQSTAAKDELLYAGAPFAGNRAPWEQALKDRARGQTEYTRVR